MDFESIVKKFIDNRCYLSNGAGLLSGLWGVDKSIIKAARTEARNRIRNIKEFGTEYHPKDVAFGNKTSIVEDVSSDELKEISKQEGKLKSKWFNGKTWCESYDYTKEDVNTINFESILTKVFVDAKLSNEPLTNLVVSSDYNLNVFLADQHIGASVEHSLYSNYFDKVVYKNRMNKVFMWIVEQAQIYGGFKNITIFFLGDTFDGQDGFTVKRTHDLPQNMSNEECFEVGLYTNKVFLERLFKSGLGASYGVYYVRESNHGGSMDYFLFTALDMWIKTSYPEVTSKIGKSFIDHVEIDGTTFIYTHGKDNKDMKSGLPLNLDAKAENFINQYIYENNIKGNIRFIKADLHQNALNEGKLFTYRNVPSLFGSSKWIMSNYGVTEPGVGVEIFNSKTVFPSVIDL